MDHKRGRLLRGAREIAEYALGDEELFRTVYAVAHELPCFVLGGYLCAFTGSLDEALAAKENAPCAKLPPRRKPRDADLLPRRKARNTEQERGAA
jgi:hypothetical protein